MRVAAGEGGGAHGHPLLLRDTPGRESEGAAPARVMWHGMAFFCVCGRVHSARMAATSVRRRGGEGGE